MKSKCWEIVHLSSSDIPPRLKLWGDLKELSGLRSLHQVHRLAEAEAEALYINLRSGLVVHSRFFHLSGSMAGFVSEGVADVVIAVDIVVIIS